MTGIKLASQGVHNAELITPLVFMIVLGTVLLNATTARPFAKLVGVFQTESNGILIIGSSSFSRVIAKYLIENGRHVIIVDNNQSNIEAAKKMGIEAINANVYSDDLADNIELSDIGYMMALTGNSAVNDKAIENFSSHFGGNGVYRVISSDEMRDPTNNPKEGLFSYTDDYIKLVNLTRKFPEIHEIPIASEAHFDELIEHTNNDPDAIPLFIKELGGELKLIPSNNSQLKIDEGYKFVYLGKEISNEFSTQITQENSIKKETNVD